MRKKEEAVFAKKWSSQYCTGAFALVADEPECFRVSVHLP